MYNILSIDTTTNICYIGLYYNNNLFKFSRKYNFNYLDKILYDIDYFLFKNNISIKNINIIVCICGPGDFTSTKIGICICHGLSFGIDIPIIKINSLEILAYSSYLYFNKKNNIISMINGYSKLIYWSEFYISRKNICISKFKVIKFTYLCDIIKYINKFDNEYIISGNAYTNHINKFLDNKNILFSKIKVQKIEDVISLSLKLISLNKFSNFKKVLPIY
ncbi:tRNA (adenosine(37)-N6)-threonylcarbamoyltransferase complex dimerization subunit type 1 TsaB [endosymbiont of Pachyrhynchus infernalis]|uniref:tRNA (adenosine(37)-N6)-threonylcarbamoyltransferase complex dimerization subunit type 1 TsaB n=1 Tax=endosymbiont of Pachyrhynchus infernalis TaxID=1971488 RepID=UPI000DC715FB|nr:tRNA (adenosine(37)-N6)-threonylcarbamoyltransferase complex dimerization subunit type 1 TsaB [endosymbiont of Pachyrhynchus infernalis]BBA84794.1 uncharacterized protein NARPIN1_00520 [endosymbiont of Pachyrhynchus infernalis]